MPLTPLTTALPEFAKDTRLNLTTLLNGTDVDELSAQRLAGVALACAYATKHAALIETLQHYGQDFLTANDVEGIKIAVSIMAMNNIYYRFLHMASDPVFKTLPAKLRMNKMAAAGISAVDFELYSLAVSALEGCQLCVDTHVSALKKHGLSHVAIQTAIRLAAIINATAQSLCMAGHELLR